MSNESTPTAELPKQYRPIDHEDRIWSKWESANAFHADPTRVLRGEAKPYAIVIPPPNVTAALHLGHALNNSLQDILIRAKRKQGFETLWMPGTDHAGIATQAVVEKRLRKEGALKGPLRDAFTRDQFVEKIQAFKDEYEAIITSQLKKMGCSCDWARQRFTMDDQCARAVREAFFRLFKDDLIYRGKRLVNWDPALQTAVADDECYDEEIDGAFYYLRYPLVHLGNFERTIEEGNQRADAQPVTWGELARRGYEGAAHHPPESQAWITVATTRPETYLGDTAVAVNPHDPRAGALKGLHVELPLVGRLIPIVEDSYVVLPERFARTDEEKYDPKAKMATGFLKVTPAHDPNDYEIGQRHKQAIEALGNPVLINVMAPDATISDKHGWTDTGDAKLFLGLSREQARKKTIEEFKARTVGHEPLFEGSKPHRHSVKHSDRSKAIVEPYLSDQWYVKVTDPRMAKAANEALSANSATGGPALGGSALQSGATWSGATKDNTLTFHPDRYAKTYEQWHDNIRDWCISRQLWWGHRIPVWSHADPNRIGGAASSIVKFIQQGRLASQQQTPIDPESRTRNFCVLDPMDTEVISLLETLGYVQDPDVLDTWFSSALWPMSTMGWPDATDLLRAFNPTSTLCTAREIITLWVSRMVMFNRYLMPEGWPNATGNGTTATIITGGHGLGPVPFRDVFIHAVIQDGEGRKMSKSLGNGVDPLDIIATHGADAMRFTLCQMTTQTQDVRMPVAKDPATGKNTSPKFDLGRNFATKLWNATRFALTFLSTTDTSTAALSPASLSLTDRWMLSRLARATFEIDRALDSYEFSTYAQSCYALLWNDLCDWYLEAIKPTIADSPSQRAVLAHALETIVRLLHPIMPFVTETIWEKLKDVTTAPITGVTLGASRTGLLVTAGWPILDASLLDDAAEARFARVQSLITLVREVRAQHKVPPRQSLTLHAPTPAALADLNDEERRLVMNLTNMERITSQPAPAGVPSLTFEGAAWSIAGIATADDDPALAAAEAERHAKRHADLTKTIATLEARLANPGYAQKAPPHMVQQTRDQLAAALAEREALGA